jgi:hypothetical protein
VIGVATVLLALSFADLVAGGLTGEPQTRRGTLLGIAVGGGAVFQESLR